LTSEVLTETEVTKDPEYLRTFSDNFRQARYNLSAIKAFWKFALRTLYREFKYLWVFRDLVNLALILIIAASLILFILWFIPYSLWLTEVWFPDIFLPPPEQWHRVLLSEIPPVYSLPVPPSKELAAILHGFVWSSDVARILAGGGGILAFIIRVMLKSPIRKFKDKANARKDVCFIFGETKYAEKLIHQLVYIYGYEEKVCLVHTKPFLWIDQIKGLVNTYQVMNEEEYEKPNLYEAIEFKTTKQVMILTDDVEKNQNILTNVRAVKPDIPIIVLKQYAPKFLLEDESGLIKDSNLLTIDDLEAIINGLIFSLSLDIKYPNVSEIDVIGTFIGATGIQMTSDVPFITVLRIKRGENLLTPDNIIQDNDRLILLIKDDPLGHYFMKSMNRIVAESPHVSKEEKERKKAEKIAEKEEEKKRKDEEKKKAEEEKAKKKIEPTKEVQDIQVQEKKKKKMTKEMREELERQKTVELFKQKRDKKLQRLNKVINAFNMKSEAN
jgi:hypothetical protein